MYTVVSTSVWMVVVVVCTGVAGWEAAMGDCKHWQEFIGVISFAILSLYPLVTMFVGAVTGLPVSFIRPHPVGIFVGLLVYPGTIFSLLVMASIGNECMNGGMIYVGLSLFLSFIAVLVQELFNMTFSPSRSSSTTTHSQI